MKDIDQMSRRSVKASSNINIRLVLALRKADVCSMNHGIDKCLYSLALTFLRLDLVVQECERER